MYCIDEDWQEGPCVQPYVDDTALNNIKHDSTTGLFTDSRGLTDQPLETRTVHNDKSHVVNELEVSLQQLEGLIPETGVVQLNESVPGWAGSTRSKYLQFLARLCQNPYYQNILARFTQFEVIFSMS